MDPQLWQVISDGVGEEGGITHSQIWNLEKWLDCSHSENVVRPWKKKKKTTYLAEAKECLLAI